MVTAAANKRQQAPGYNNSGDIIYGRTEEISPQPLGLSGKEISEKGLFAGVRYAPEIDDYPPVERETRQHSTKSDDATIDNLIKSAVKQDTEERETTKKKPEVRKGN